MKNILAQEWRRIRKTAVALLLFWGIFTAVLYLYDRSLEPILYAGILCLAAGGILLGVDLFFYIRRYAGLQKAADSPENILQELPKPKGPEERLYQEMIGKLAGENRRLEDSFSKGYANLQDYYSTWAHQIKTPIAAMRLLLQAEEGRDLQKLEMELFKIEQYVELALGYLRSEDISRDLQIREYELDGIIRQAVKKYAKLFILEKISLEYEPVNTKVLTDEKWLVFVLEQLLSNALKYTRKGKISIYMDPKREKTLVIADTGIGISSQDLPRVFERGYTGCNGRAQKQSTGIGLYSVKKVMDKLSCPIWINSRLGEGTKVYLDLGKCRLEMV